MNIEKKPLALGKSCVKLRSVRANCSSVSGDFTGFQLQKAEKLARGGLAEWASFF
jgi:hypothetical protein